MQVAFLFSMKFPNNLPFQVSGYTFIKPVDGESYSMCNAWMHLFGSCTCTLCDALYTHRLTRTLPMFC